MNRGESTLKKTYNLPRSQLNRSNKRLSPRSEATQRLYEEERIPLVRRLLAERPLCQICKRNPSVDLHEIRSRGTTGGVNGRDWLDEDNILCVCRPCHTWVGDNVKEAIKLGYVA